MKLLVLALFAVGHSPDSASVELLFQKYQAHQYRTFDSAIVFLDHAIDEAGDASLRSRQGGLLREKGIYLKDRGNFPGSLEALQRSLDIFISLSDGNMQALVYNSIGITYARAGDRVAALSNYFKSRDLNLKLNNRTGLIRNYIAIGNHYAAKHEAEALANYDEALRLTGPEDKSLHALILKNTGSLYNDPHFIKHDSIKAFDYFTRSIAGYEGLGDSINVAGLYVNLGVLNENGNNLDEAERQYRRAFSIQSRLGLNGDLVGTSLNLGNVYFKRKDFDKAIEMYRRGLELSKQLGNASAYRNHSMGLALCSRQQDRWSEAYRFLFSSDSTSRLIHDQFKTTKEKELETIYETEKKQAEIELRTGQRDSMMITLIVGLSLSIIIVIIYSQRQRIVARLREREKAIMNAKVDELLREQELKSLRSYLEGQDQERKRLAEDLHDRLGSTLSATKLHFNAVNNVSHPSLQKANQLLDTAVDEVREISHNLLSGSIAKFGLKTALHELSDTITGSNQVRMEVVTHGLDTRLDGKTELHLYRVVQELVSNALKHSSANELSVQVTRNDQDLTLVVEDNGSGFDHQTEVTSGGVGLKNVNSRIESMNGSFRVDSAKGRGTTVLITIPIAV